MSRRQQFFNKVCDSLKTYGNPYGSRESRGYWNWINPSNPDERCAIARFIPGQTEHDVLLNLSEELYGSKDYLGCIEHDSLIHDIIQLFDYSPMVCNNAKLLDRKLQSIADRRELEFVY